MDVNHTWSDDIILDANIDLDIVDGLDETNQRVLRRLLTNPGEYLWHKDYGAGVGRYVGVALSTEVEFAIKNLITNQMYKEDDVSKNPPPEIYLQADNNQLTCSIDYYNKTQSKKANLRFTLS